MEYSYFEAQALASGRRLGLDIAGVRGKATKLLQIIPASGFFRTYTDHSVAHCDQMFSILTWLVPDPLRSELTYVEHALLTLAVYFHDLGMLATEEEYRNRTANRAFERFERVYTQQYDASSQKDLDHDTWDRFLFEEFIRHTHAERIADWLSGRRDALPQAQELQHALRDTSPQFRHYLGLICKSHHLNNLHDTSTFPVDARFGNGSADRANIQYIAVLLRLADILHMSRDRTPPLEFRVISPRNPVSAREWAKQLQVAGVGPSASDPTEIRVEALCTDHRMYFYLQDFIRTVNDELQRCRAWLGGAPAETASRYYLAHRLVTDTGVRAEGFLAEKFQLELDQRRVIDLLMGHNLYGDPNVAIRELLQNSIDAVRVRNLETADFPPKIAVHLDQAARTLTVLDNGIGMDLEVIRRHFLRVGDSYYRSNAFRRRCPSYTPISQFGIGFLTAFMLGNRVEVLTRSNRPDAKIYVVDLENIYDLFLVRVVEDDNEAATDVRTGGTKITIFLRPDTVLDKLHEQVKRWLVFLEFPIEVSVDGNTPTEVWGLRGDTPDEVAASILERANQPTKEFCPIVFSKDDVNITILWEGHRSGTRYLLAPAGRLLLPITDAYSWIGHDRHMRREEPTPIRKIANGGVFLSDELPGLKLKGRATIHYVIDCRGENRFTPLVSRSGVAIDAACAGIVGDLVDGLIDRIDANVRELLASGVSKYFAAYYVGQALDELFDYQRSESEEELVLSVILAVGFAARVPMALFKEGTEIVLKSWNDHAGAPICIGQNMYKGLLRSVTYGYVEFPLPSEVLESLPEYYLIDVGTDAVLRPVFFLQKYRPVKVLYDNALKGIFLRCEMANDGDDTVATFGGLPILDFPPGLEDAIGITFPLAGCLNAHHPALAVATQIVEEVVRRVGSDERAHAEEVVVKLLKEFAWDWKRRMGAEDPGQEIHYLRRALERSWDATADIPLRQSDVEMLMGARIIREELWSYDRF